MSASETSPAAAASRFRIFRAAEAAALDEQHMPTVNVTPADAAGMAEAYATGAGEGAMARMIFADPVSGMSLCYLWFKAGFVLPRHSHDADCAYYVVSGELQLGTETLKAGDGFFVPSDCDYQYAAGPEGVEVVEFRTATQFHLRLAGNGEAAWRRMSAAARANLERWRTQVPPPAAARMLRG
jgi:quercetin dioxygenase-like cupin family protein